MAATLPPAPAPDVDPEILEPTNASPPHVRHRNLPLLIGLGIFVTSFGNDQYLAQIPLQFVLKNQMHVSETVMSVFFAVTGLAWYFKPITGLLSDSFPLFGTRRRWYLIIGSVVAGALWAGFSFAPHRYAPFLWTDTAINVLIVLCSTVVGALLVEEGRSAGATGLLSSVRSSVMNAASLAAGPLGGFFADKAFGWTCGVCAGLCVSLAVATFLILREKPNAKVEKGVWIEAGKQLKSAFTSKTLLLAALFTFLITFAPGFNTPLFYYQTNTLNFSGQFIGNLAVFSGIGGIAGSLLYAPICRKVDLKGMIISSIVVSGLSSFLYLHYHNAHQAEFVETVNGLTAGYVNVMTLDLAAQATPLGCEAMAYALMMSAYNVAIQGANILGSWLSDHFHLSFPKLVWINGVTTLITLLAIPLLPKAILLRRDGDETYTEV